MKAAAVGIVGWAARSSQEARSTEWKVAVMHLSEDNVDVLVNYTGIDGR